MSDGREKLSDFSLLKSLVGGKSIKDKTDRLRKAHENAKKRKPDSGVKASSEDVKNSNRNQNQGLNKRRQTRQSRMNQGNTPFCMPQYGQKQQTELKVDLPENAEEVVVNIDVDKEQLKEERRLFLWLCQRFPKCFNPKDKKPLKIGISHDVEVVYQNEHMAPVDQYILRNVIKRYVGDTRYQRSVLEYKQRYNLYGKPQESFSDEHLEYAEKRLDEIAEKAKLRAQGIDIKEYYQKKREQLQENSQSEVSDEELCDVKINDISKEHNSGE